LKPQSPVKTIQSGVGGTRTLVQTRKQFAFYMLIFPWFFEKK